jgi:hypothetical protein
VRFTIVIPPVLSLQRLSAIPRRGRRDGTARNPKRVTFNTNVTRQSMRYTTGADGQVTVSLP